MLQRQGEVATYDQCFLVVNPVSTNARSGLIQHQLAEVMTTFPDSHIIETTGNDRIDAHMLRSVLLGVRNAMVGVCGGDGVIGKSAAVLAQEEFQDKEIVLAAFGAGNGNDFARSINGRLHQTSMLDIIRYGQPIPVHPIRARIHTEAEMVEQLALNCWGIGASSTISAHLNDPNNLTRNTSYPILRTISEGRLLLSVIRGLEPFTISDLGGVNVREGYELLFINSGRVGKYGKMPLEAGDDRSYKLEVASKRLPHLVRTIGRMLLGTHSSRPQNYLDSTEAFTFKIKSDEVPGQIDGETCFNNEPIVFKKDSLIIIDRHPYAVSVLKAPAKIVGTY